MGKSLEEEIQYLTRQIEESIGIGSELQILASKLVGKAVPRETIRAVVNYYHYDMIRAVRIYLDKTALNYTPISLQIDYTNYNLSISTIPIVRHNGSDCRIKKFRNLNDLKVELDRLTSKAVKPTKKMDKVGISVLKEIQAIFETIK